MRMLQGMNRTQGRGAGRPYRGRARRAVNRELRDGDKVTRALAALIRTFDDSYHCAARW